MDAVLDQRRIRRERLLERAHDRQLLVLDHDLPDGRLRGRLVHGRDRGHRLAREPDPVDGHDGPVLDGVAPVRVDVQDVRAREHGDDARHRERRRGVDGHDPGVGHRAAQHLAVEHPGHAHVAHVPGIATQLVVRVHAAHRATHLGGRDAPAGGAPRRSCAAHAGQLAGRIDDGSIAGAPTQVAGEAVANGLLVGHLAGRPAGRGW